MEINEIGANAPLEKANEQFKSDPNLVEGASLKTLQEMIKPLTEISPPETESQTAELVLYFFPGCPYCDKVIRYLEENGRSLPMRNTLEDKAAFEELREIGGKTQVPCLVINGKALYESNDIIAWLKTN